MDAQTAQIQSPKPCQPKARFPRRLRRVLRQRLRNGERVLWVGHPQRRLGPEKGELDPVTLDPIISVGFTLVGSAMVIGAAATNLLANERHGVPAQCRIVLIAGLTVCAVFFPFALDYLCSGRTVYVLTSQRAIIWTPWWIGRLGFSSYPLLELGPFFVRNAHGGNDLELREREELWAGEAGILTVRVSFRDLRDPQHIRRLAISAQTAARRAGITGASQ